MAIEVNKAREAIKQKPGEDCSTITLVFFSPTSLDMSLPIRLHRILFRALIALPLLLAVLPAIMFLNSGQVAESSTGVVVHTCCDRAYIDPLPNLGAGPLPKLPRKIVASPMQLEVLVPLKPLVADLTNKPVCCH